MRRRSVEFVPARAKILVVVHSEISKIERIGRIAPGAKAVFDSLLPAAVPFKRHP
jgi:hypothetical protein